MNILLYNIQLNTQSHNLHFSRYAFDSHLYGYGWQCYARILIRYATIHPNNAPATTCTRIISLSLQTLPRPMHFPFWLSTIWKLTFENKTEQFIKKLVSVFEIQSRIHLRKMKNILKETVRNQAWFFKNRKIKMKSFSDRVLAFQYTLAHWE